MESQTPVAETGADSERLVEAVRERYGRVATEAGSCCGPRPAALSAGSVSQAIGYSAAELESVPEGTDLNLGCGAPIPLLDLKSGETVLDLGSGAGLDCFLAARKVGPQGKVIGVDMTRAMLERARQAAQRGGFTQVEFREGRLESLPVESSSVDAVTSNCVINLVPDKGAVFREVARVLRAGGRMVISDIILDGELPEAVRSDTEFYVGCVSGAVPRAEYLTLLREAGLGQVEVLSDADYTEALRRAAPDTVREFEQRAGVKAADLAGIVHSVTLRATKVA